MYTNNLTIIYRNLLYSFIKTIKTDGGKQYFLSDRLFEGGQCIWC